MIGLFLVGCFITAIVAAACWLVVTGIREDNATATNSRRREWTSQSGSEPATAGRAPAAARSTQGQ